MPYPAPVITACENGAEGTCRFRNERYIVAIREYESADYHSIHPYHGP